MTALRGEAKPLAQAGPDMMAQGSSAAGSHVKKGWGLRLFGRT